MQAAFEPAPGLGETSLVHAVVHPARVVGIAVLVDQARLTELAQMVGDEILRERKHLGNFAVADLAFDHQEEDAPTRRVSEQPEECGGLR
ncbi:MAG: hypothetical protein M0004_03680 [Actinomycetota bacterium]|nr:hypothetical protein [Actinomycetota bacterium]